ncbi:MAG: chloride channel protein, partial [Clostridia bacterium]|nr:chloride channel protein [Clostridia bacterium]
MNTKINNYFRTTLVPGLLLSGLAGIFTGAVVFFYRFAAHSLLEFTQRVYAFVGSNAVHLPWFFAALAALAVLTALTLKFVPEAGGGGMAKAAGILRGLITFKWLRMLVGSIVASLLGFFAGLPLGSEGPSLQIGAAMGAGTHRLAANKKPEWKKYIMTASASAGFGVVTGAPLAGAVFALEEIHKRFSPMLIIVAFSGTLAAAATAQGLGLLFGVSPNMFDFGNIPPLSISGVWIPLAAGVAAGLTSCAFNSVMLLVGRFFDGKLAKIPQIPKFIGVFLLVGIAGLFFSDVIGGGYGLIAKITAAGIV